MLVAVIAQCPGALAKLIGEAAQIPAGTEVLVNRGALAVAADRTQTIGRHEGATSHRLALAWCTLRMSAVEPPCGLVVGRGCVFLRFIAAVRQ
jgi:hypothetical protein